VRPASNGVAASAEQRDGDRLDAVANEGQIVVIRPQVVETIGHVLGNLFQRIYHLVDRAGESSAETASDLGASVRRLENFLQLVMDYVSPQSLNLQYVAATEVVQSLARQLSDRVGCAVRVDAKMAPEGRLLVDPGRLARGFGLLAGQLEVAQRSTEVIELKAIARPAGRSMVVNVLVPRCFVSPWTSESEMQWSVAEKLLDMHGGVLQRRSALTGEASWEISVPLQP
jgi:hypothetical protein